MRVFVYELTCLAAAESATAKPLQPEGWAMLAAVIEDLVRLADVEPITLLHPSCPDLPGCRIVQAVDERRQFEELAAAADWTLVIAPEFDGLLLDRCRRVEAVGGRLLSSSVAAVQLTADKLALAEYWRRHDVPTPETLLLRTDDNLPDSTFPAVCKPRDGAGSQATFLVRKPEDLALCCACADAEGWRGDLLLQPFVPGLPASVAFLMGPRQIVPLLGAEQLLSQDGRFRYEGGVLPLPAALAERCVRLARRAVEAVPGLRGYVGVDLILGNAADGSGDVVIEINPRLTTSYVGLRALADGNLAQAMLRVAMGEEVPPPVWRRGRVCFEVGGQISFMPELDDRPGVRL